MDERATEGLPWTRGWTEKGEVIEITVKVARDSSPLREGGPWGKDLVSPVYLKSDIRE